MSAIGQDWYKYSKTPWLIVLSTGGVWRYNVGKLGPWPLLPAVPDAQYRDFGSRDFVHDHVRLTISSNVPESEPIRPSRGLSLRRSAAATIATAIRLAASGLSLAM